MQKNDAKRNQENWMTKVKKPVAVGKLSEGVKKASALKSPFTHLNDVGYGGSQSSMINKQTMASMIGSRNMGSQNLSMDNSQSTLNTV